MKPAGFSEVAFGGPDSDVAKEELNLLQFAAGGAAEPSATSAEIVCGASLVSPILAAGSLTTCRTSFSVTVSPQVRPALLTRRNSLPDSMPAATVGSFDHSVGQAPNSGRERFGRDQPFRSGPF
jgi:hypothetical protein